MEREVELEEGKLAIGRDMAEYHSRKQMQVIIDDVPWNRL